MKRVKDYKQWLDYKVGDRVQYMSVGAGTVTSHIKHYGHYWGLNIELDEPAPVEFNMGHKDVIAISTQHVSILK